MSLPSHRAAILLAVLTATLFSTGGAAVKATSLGAWQVAAGRAAVAALTVAVLLPASRRGWSRRTWGVGLAYALTVVTYVHANKLTTAAAAIFLQATAPLYVILLAPLLLREPARRRDLVLALFVAVGLAVFFLGADAPSRTAPRPVLGNLIAAASGVAYALTLLGLRALSRSAHQRGAAPRSDPGLGAVVCGNLLAVGICAPFAWPVGAVTTRDLLAVGYLGVFQIGIAYAVMAVALRSLSAVEGSLLLLLEPVLNPVWAVLLLGERPGGWSLIGGAVVLGATAWHAATSGARRPLERLATESAGRPSS